MFVNGSGQNEQSFRRKKDIFGRLRINIYDIIDFLAHLAKGNVSFCHHLASVVCRPLTFHILIFSSETPQPNKLKLGMKHPISALVNF
jgi:hypothetical protein